MNEKSKKPRIDWGEAFNHQGPDSVDHIEQVLASIQIGENQALREGSRGASRFGEIFDKFEFDLSAEAANLLLQLADLPNDANILFPRNDIGILGFCIRQHHPDIRMTFWSDDVDIAAFHSYVFPDDNVANSSSLMELATQQSDEYDLIIGGIRSKKRWKVVREEGSNISSLDTHWPPQNYDDWKFLDLLSKLLKDGRTLISDMWVHSVDERFLEERNRLRQWLEKLHTVSGLGIDAVIEDIDGLRRLEDAIVIQSKSPQGQLFSAQYSEDPGHQETIISGFLNQSSAKRAHAGIWSSLNTFEPNSRHRHLEQVRLMAELAGLSPFSFEKLIPKSRSEDSTETEPENDLYISQGYSLASGMDSFRPLTVTHRSADCDQGKGFRVPIDPDKALAEYLAQFLNESHLGKMIAPDLIAGTDVVNFWASDESILGCEVWLPDIHIQEEVVRNRNALSSIQSEIDEIVSLQWRDPKNVEEVRRQIGRINTEDSFPSWLDQLPFPLASILWAYHAQSRTDKERYEYLLKFFEALAEFLCIVHMSAIYPPTSKLWVEFSKKVKESKRSIPLKLTTFGRWRTLLVIMAEFIRDGIRDDRLRLEMLDAYKVSQTAHVEQLTHRSILASLEFANELRNNIAGHVGAIGDRQASDIHQKLRYSLQQARDQITGIWEYYDLVIPGAGKYSGGEYAYKGKRAWGTRIPFERIEFNTIEPLEADHLHLVSRMTNRAIRLLPFLQVVPGPSTDVDACYFYSRIERDSDRARFVSYHFTQENEIFPTVSPEIWEVIKAF